MMTLTARASTVWTGPVTNYTQPAPNDGTTAAQQDRIMPDLWLTRANRAAMFNAAPPYSEGFYDGVASPKNTMWAIGTIDQYADLTYDTWANVIGGEGSGPDAPLYQNLPGQQFVVHIVSDDIYFAIQFTSWTPFGAGGYSYSRSTPAAVVSPTPTVTLTNPAVGAVFAAPASLKLGATASVSSGTVTNVSFFAGSTLLGSAKTSPFNVTGSSLGAGSYNLTAVATAAGISATSSVVSISVVAPIPITNTVPVRAGGNFTFKYSANVGLTYVVQRSTNLPVWTPISTNVATNTSISFSDTSVTNGARYYSVFLQPNP
jgi:hypothetical protein